MKLNHINLVVTNMAEAIHLFEIHFGFRCIETKGENIIAVLKGADDFTLVLMTSKDNDMGYPSAFHIGFMQDNRDAVTTIYNNLKSDGFDAGREPGKIRDSFGFYFVFGAIMIEVGYYLK